MELPAGFYWVRWTGRPNEPWTIALLKDEDGISEDFEPATVQYWYLIGSDFFYCRENFERDHEIGKRIVPEAQ